MTLPGLGAGLLFIVIAAYALVVVDVILLCNGLGEVFSPRQVATDYAKNIT